MRSLIGGTARVAAAAAILVGLAACDSQQPMTRTGMALDHAGTVTGSAVGQAGQATGTAVDNAGTYVKKQVQ